MNNFYLTFISQTPIIDETIADIIGDYKSKTWLSQGKALDVELMAQPGEAALAYIRAQVEAKKIDVLLTQAKDRKKQLLLADMDSTIVTSETLDDMAAQIGIGAQVADITARAMNGELDFHAAIKERVGLLAGKSTSIIQDTLKETQLTSGARTFVQTMKAGGAKCILVSGGFTIFTSQIAEQCGFDAHHGNTLGIDGDTLTGEVIPPILDKESKLKFLNEYADQFELSLNQALTIGDGANDLPMLQAAGLGLGFHAKPSVAAQITNTIRFNDLTAALYAQGIPESNWVN